MIELRPGEEIKIVVPATMGFCPSIGKSETRVRLTYTEILGMLSNRRNRKKLWTLSSKLSRNVSLVSQALLTGKWANGAVIDSVSLTKELVYKLHEISSRNSINLTKKGKDNFTAICNHWKNRDEAIYNELLELSNKLE